MTQFLQMRRGPRVFARAAALLCLLGVLVSTAACSVPADDAGTVTGSSPVPSVGASPSALASAGASQSASADGPDLDGADSAVRIATVDLTGGSETGASALVSDGEGAISAAGVAVTASAGVTVEPVDSATARIVVDLAAALGAPVPAAAPTTAATAAPSGAPSGAEPARLRWVSIDATLPDGTTVGDRGGSVVVRASDGALLAGFASPASGFAALADGVLTRTSPPGDVTADQWDWQRDANRLILTTAVSIPASVTGRTAFLFGTAVAASSEWVEDHAEGGRSLHVTPSLWARVSPDAVLALGPAGLGDSPDPDAHLPTMASQLACHAVGAPAKDTWNLEPWRPDGDLLTMALALCNPTQADAPTARPMPDVSATSPDHRQP